MLETKEQIRTELINELIEIFNELTTTTKNRDFLLGIEKMQTRN